MTTPFTQVWADFAAGGTPISAARLTNLVTSLQGVISELNGRLSDATLAASTALVEPHDLSVIGDLIVMSGKSKIYFEGSYTLLTVRASVDTAPTGAAVICDVHKNGITIYTNQANRPTIAVSTKTATANAPDVTTFVAGDYLSIDIDQIGSVVKGADLTVTVRLRRTA